MSLVPKQRPRDWTVTSFRKSQWICLPGLKVWTRLPLRPDSSFGKVHVIHDNFDRPFLVHERPGLERVVCVHQQASVSDGTVAFRAVPSLTFERVVATWVSDGTVREETPRHFRKDRFFAGANVLLQKHSGNQYVFIGQDVISFRTPSPVRSFHSYIGPNDVPYSWATTDSDIVLLSHRRGGKSRLSLVRRSTVGESEDVYAIFYQLSDRMKRKHTIPYRTILRAAQNT